MPRRKISEFRSKKIITNALGLKYTGWEVVNGKVPAVPVAGVYVVKVDQAVKQRFKRGLIYLSQAQREISGRVKELTKKGFQFVLIEPHYVHDITDERYISLVREREGVVLSYSRHGGVEIEASEHTVKSGLVHTLDMKKVATETGLSKTQLLTLVNVFNEQYMSLLEINPYTLKNGELRILDVAIEVDSVAELLASEWSGDDYRSSTKTLTNEELAVQKLNNESPASFSLEVINPDGGIFLLLSGGGASVVIADEIFMMGHGKHLANYGEYSGNPSTDETEIYTRQVVKLLLKSKAKKKVVLIGGAVANFTDIKNTFKGIITVLEEFGDELHSLGVRFYVRRGGPRQTEGLREITVALKKIDILGGVYDPSVTIPTAVSNLVKEL